MEISEACGMKIEQKLQNAFHQIMQMERKMKLSAKYYWLFLMVPEPLTNYIIKKPVN